MQQAPTPVREFATPFAAFLAAQAEVEKAPSGARYITTFDGYVWLLSDRAPIVRTRTTHVYRVTRGAQAEELTLGEI